MPRTNDDEVIRKRSGWLLPLGAISVVVGLSAVLMLYYLAPGTPGLFHEQVSPTSRQDRVALSVRGVALSIPANYLAYESDRQGGTRRDIALIALAPAMTGWSHWRADAFADHGASSRVVNLSIREDRNDMSEAVRLKRVYMGYVTDEAGSPAPYALKQYAFRAGSGYDKEDLFVGESGGAVVTLRCVRASVETPNPNCLRDKRIAPGVSLSYRFKRAHLSEWRAIAEGADAMLTSFRDTQR